MDKRVLHLVKPLQTRLHHTQLDAFELAASDCGYRIHIDANLERIISCLNAEPTNFMIVGAETLSRMISVHGFTPNPQTILFLTERENPVLYPHIEHLSHLQFVIGSQQPPVIRSLLAAIFDFKTTNYYTMLTNRLINKQHETLSGFVLHNSGDRNSLQNNVVSFFAGELQKHREKIVARTLSYPKNLGDILEEFLMNAIWDASPERVAVDRRVSVNLEQDEGITVECRSDGTTLGLSVIDPHGTFPLRAFFGPVRYTVGYREEKIVNEGPGGAGIGLYMIMQKANILAFEVHQNHLTRVTAILRCDQSLRDMQKRPRTALLFYKHH